MNEGNKNARKDDADRADAHLHIRVKHADRAGWMERAKAEGLSLSRWVIQKLNRRGK